jgi:hypothetical protein
MVGDEAHRMSAHCFGGKQKSKRFRLAEKLGRRARASGKEPLGRQQSCILVPTNGVV